MRHPKTTSSLPDVDALIGVLVEWATAAPAIAAVALVGSYARNAARADSDVDIMVLTETPSAFFEDRAWLKRFGAVARQREEVWGRVRTLRAWLASGRELEINFVTPDWAKHPIDAGTKRVIDGGIRVLFDRTGVLSAGAPDSTEPDRAPCTQRTRRGRTPRRVTQRRRRAPARGGRAS